MKPTRRRFVVASIFVYVCTGVLAYAQHFGSWVYAPGNDPITNEDTSMMYAPAQEYPRGAGDSALVIRCQRDSTYNVAVYFYADRYLGLADRMPVTYRIGSESPVEAVWNASTSNEAVFVPSDRHGTLLTALRRNPRFVIRIDASQDVLTYQLDTTGLGGALMRLTCYTGP